VGWGLEGEKGGERSVKGRKIERRVTGECSVSRRRRGLGVGRGGWIEVMSMGRDIQFI